MLPLTRPHELVEQACVMLHCVWHAVAFRTKWLRTCELSSTKVTGSLGFVLCSKPTERAISGHHKED